MTHHAVGKRETEPVHELIEELRAHGDNQDADLVEGLYEALKNCVHALNFCLGMLPTDDPFRTKITKNRDDAVAALSRALPEPTERKT